MKTPDIENTTHAAFLQRQIDTLTLAAVEFETRGLTDTAAQCKKSAAQRTADLYAMPLELAAAPVTQPLNPKP